MKKGWERLFHAHGRTSSADVAGDGQKVLHVYEVGFLVAGGFCGFFEVYLAVAGNDAYEMATPLALEHEGLDVVGCEIDRVDSVWDKFKRYSGGLQQSGCVGFGRSSHDKSVIYINMKQKYKNSAKKSLNSRQK